MKILSIVLSVFLWTLSLWLIVLNIIEYEQGDFLVALITAYILMVLGIILFSGKTKLLSVKRAQNFVPILIALLGWVFFTYIILSPFIHRDTLINIFGKDMMNDGEVTGVSKDSSK